MKQYTRIRLCVSMLAVALCYCVPSIVCGQENDSPLDLLRRFPADPTIIQANIIDTGKQMLAWEIERATDAVTRMKRDIDVLEQKIAELEQRMSVLTEDGMGVFAFTSDAVRAELIGRVLERLLDARVDIAAEEALVSHLEGNMSKSETEMIAELNAFKAQRDALEGALRTLNVERDRLKALHARNAVSKAELMRSEALIRNHEVQIAALDVEKESVARKEAAKVAAPLADARLSLVAKRAREKMAARQLVEITSAAKFAPRVRQAQREIDRYLSILESRVQQLHEAEVELAESRAFLERIEKQLKEHRDGSSKPNEE